MIKLKKFDTRPVNAILKDFGIAPNGRVQKYLDKRVAEHLQPYVSFKTGAQQNSITSATVYGSGKVRIWVDYAVYQAYWKKIKKRVGKRGTYPFERMCQEKKDTILHEVANYARR
jgi:hypothetical protein